MEKKPKRDQTKQGLSLLGETTRRDHPQLPNGRLGKTDFARREKRSSPAPEAQAVFNTFTASLLETSAESITSHLCSGDPARQKILPLRMSTWDKRRTWGKSPRERASLRLPCDQKTGSAKCAKSQHVRGSKGRPEFHSRRHLGAGHRRH